MKIYWTLKSIPELKDLSLQERGRRWRNAYKSAFRHWQTWAGLTVCGASCYVGTYLFGAFGSFILAGLGGFFYGQVVTRVILKYYRHRLCGQTS